MYQADPPVIANGVVFAYGSGEDTTQATADIGLAVQHGGEPRRALDARDALRARRADRRRSSGRAATRSRRSTTSAACRSPTAASTSAPTTACSTASASTATRGRYAVMRNGIDQMRLGDPCRPAIVAAPLASPRWLHGAGPRRRRVDHERLRRAAHRWVRSDARLTKDAVAEGQFKFLWKTKFDNETRQLNSLTQPVLLDRLIGYPRLQGARLRRRQRRSRLRDRHRPRRGRTGRRQSQLRGGHRRPAAELVGLPRRADRDAEPAHRARAVGVRRGGGGGGRGGRERQRRRRAGQGRGGPRAERAAGTRRRAPARGRAAGVAPPAGRSRAATRRFRSAASIRCTRWAATAARIRSLSSDGADAEPPVPFLPPSAKPVGADLRRRRRLHDARRTAAAPRPTGSGRSI